MYPHEHICGCYYFQARNHYASKRVYLPQVAVKAHTTILETTSRTLLAQSFTNPSKSKGIKEIRYTFPLYDGVSVVGFTCTIGDRAIEGQVKEKEKARTVYKDAVSKGQTAGLLEEIPNASDVFMTIIGNVPPGATVMVNITYLGELKHDAEVDGVRFTIPTTVAPRYGDYPSALAEGYKNTTSGKGFDVTVDVILSHGSFIQQIRSPSHPIAVSLGTTSVDSEADPASHRASATLSLGSAQLYEDFVIQVVSKDIGNPKAVLEAHPTIPGQRALMVTLVPRFNLPPERPEIVFLCDRSGSMGGSRIDSLKKALKVFLKSLPVGIKFNICSFGSGFSFLWPKSQSYSQATLDKAMSHVEEFDANFGGTSMYGPVEATLKQRFTDMNLEVFLVTDGEIWDQDELFALLNTEIGVKKAPIRVFTLGIGNAFSSALVEGLARAGKGFSQAVGSTENCSAKVVRMLKGALSPHIDDYTLEVKYSAGEDDNFDIIEKVTDSMRVNLTIFDDKTSPPKKMTPISLFDTSAKVDAWIEDYNTNAEDGQARYAHLPAVETPKMLQAPHVIPPLFPFSRATVYLLMSPETTQKTPKSVILRATSAHGPLELEIPVDVLKQPADTIHQLAAKKAIADLQEGHPHESRGWLADAKDSSNVLVKDKYPGRFPDMVEREAVRLGIQFQIGSKWCSFVAVETEAAFKDKDSNKEIDSWEHLDDQPLEPSSPAGLGEDSARQGATRSGRPFRARGSSPAQSSPSPTTPQSSSIMYCLGSPRDSRQISQSISMGMVSRASMPSRQTTGTPGGGSQATAYSLSPSAPITPANFTSASPQFQFQYQAQMVPKAGVTNSFSTVSAQKRRKMTRSSNESPDSVSSSDGNTGFPPFSGQLPPQYNTMEEAKPVDPLHVLIALQEFEGYWIPNAHFCQVTGLDLEKVKAAVAKLGVDGKWLATALAIRYFVGKLAKEKGTWELVVEKAKAWLEAQGCDEGNGVWTVEISE